MGFGPMLAENHNWPNEFMPYNSFAPSWDMWTPSDDVWYRIELLFKFSGTTGFQCFPRIYSVDGALLFDWLDFAQWGAPDEGTQTLEQTYSNPPSSYLACPSLAYFNDLSFGNNGPGGTLGGEWYIGDIKVVDGTNLQHDDPNPWVGI